MTINAVNQVPKAVINNVQPATVQPAAAQQNNQINAPALDQGQILNPQYIGKGELVVGITDINNQNRQMLEHMNHGKVYI